MSRDTILTSIKLAANHAIFAEGTANSLRYRSKRAVRVELLADCAGRGENGGVL